MATKPPYTLRTRFARDIVAEFLPPFRKTKTEKVIIICGGMPTLPSKRELVYFFSQKGYWTFYPRYRGSWESDGQFLKISPHYDILDIINQLPHGFEDVWSKKKYRVNFQRLFLVGGSFGGPAQLLNSCDSRVNKIVSVSPVVDWRAPSKTERLDIMFPFLHQGFGNGYRLKEKDWNKLRTGKFYNPAYQPGLIDGSKALLIHALDDDVVGARSVTKFAKLTKSRLIMLKKGGHMRMSIMTSNRFYPRIKKFLNS